jgi:hypothetical protein
MDKSSRNVEALQPLRQRTNLQADAGERQVQAGENGGKCLRLAGDLASPMICPEASRM